MPDRQTSLAVIGAGPGGYAAAFAAADKGLDVLLIGDEPQPGGVCLHRGCIPSKALLHLAKLINETREAGAMGLAFQDPTIDLSAIRNWVSDQVVGRLAGGVAQLAKQRNVEYVQGRASFEDSSTLLLDGPDGGRVRFEHAIVATGSSPVRPGPLNVDDPRVMDSTDALRLDEVPESLLIIGGGYIGLEMGTLYDALGSDITVVEMLDGILPGGDSDLVRPLKKILAERFEAIHLNTKVLEIRPDADGIHARFEGPDGEAENTFDKVLIAVGRTPNSSGLGLENTKAEVNDHGFVVADRRQHTADPHILAIGDVAGEPMLAHKASREAKIAVESLIGEESVFDNAAIPAVVFTDPEVAWCGLTETQAKQQNRSAKALRFPWAASGRAVTLSRTEGLTKLIYDPQTERLLGVGIVGVGAGELIAEGALAVEMGASVRDLAETIHAHPTLSETMMESAELAFGGSTHVFRPRR